MMSFIGPLDLEMPMRRLTGGVLRKGLRIGSEGGILAGVISRYLSGCCIVSRVHSVSTEYRKK